MLTVDYSLFLTAGFVGDPGRIRQILTNLIGNAVKFTTEGSVTVSVSGTPDPDSGKVALQVTVEDTGIGIPEDMIDHVFGEFNQVESEQNRQFDGTGLGLAITKKLIKMMGGRIWLTSEQGVGSCFGFEISLDPTEAADVPHPNLNPALRHVMVIDDFAKNLELLRRQIEGLGLKVTACSSGAEALAALDKTVDLILTDHVMDDMNGLEFAKALRDGGHKQKTILLSSNHGYARKDPLSEHVDTICQRPFLRRDLFGWLEATIPVPQDTTEQTEVGLAVRNLRMMQAGTMMKLPPPRRGRCAFSRPRTTRRTVWSLARC